VKTVPAGTFMTILGPAPKLFSLPFIANRYYVRLEPADLPSDLDIILQLNRGIEGNMDGLNPDLFCRASDSTKIQIKQKTDTLSDSIGVTEERN
jgi:hypothetical protein